MSLTDTINCFSEPEPAGRDKWMAFCQGHDDGANRGRKSLSLRLVHDEDGRKVLVHCFAGCQASEAVAAAGLTMSDLFEREAVPRVFASKPTVVATYDYVTADGELRYQVLRYEPKGFSQRRPDPASPHHNPPAWLNNMHGVEPLLYRLDKIQQAGKARRWLCITAGEKDADRFAAFGWPATTNHGGEGQWKDAHTVQALAIKPQLVVILEDHDDAGMKRTARIAPAFLAAGVTVKVITAAELGGLPPKGDVSDWLDAGHDKDELLEIIKQTRSYVAPATGKQIPTHSLSIQDGTDIVRRRMDWLWPGRLARGVPTLLIGDPDLGKGLTLSDITARITTGRPWVDEPLETPPREPRHVIILSAEDPADIILEPRLHAAGADPRYYTIVNGVIGADGEERGLSLEVDVAELNLLAEERNSAALIIDPLNAYLSSTETNTDNKVRVSLKPLIRMIAQRNLASIALMHLGKDSDRAALYRSLGSIGFTAAARASFCVARDPADPQSLRRLFLPVKFNIGPAPRGLVFQVTPDSVPAPDGGEPISTARVEWLPETTTVTADEALGRSKGGADKAEAAELFLEKALGSGPVLVEALKEQAKTKQISRRALEQAKKTVGVRYRKVGLGGAWECYLDSQAVFDVDASTTTQVVENGASSPLLHSLPPPFPATLRGREWKYQGVTERGGRDHSTPPTRVAENGASREASDLEVF
jgi:hypothetical protein